MRRIPIPTILGVAILAAPFVASETLSFNHVWAQSAGQPVDPAAGIGAPPPALPPEAFDESDSTDGMDDKIEVLARGPVHEAYATQPNLNPEPGPVVQMEPPEPIDEVPPDVKPNGDNVEWIPGYYALDADEENFIWISGCWRDAPPGQRWVPGYWQQVEGGYQWISGFWMDADAEELTYLAPPPESLENGPSSPAPSDDYFYVSGCWEPTNNQYSWRPGYWAPYQSNYVWSPATYVYTPRGYVFQRGYWDYQLARRGTLFAPIRPYAGWRGYNNYRYTPVAAILFNQLQYHLFARTGGRYYYFGNYYGNNYNNRFRPWYANTYGRGFRDPLFGYYNWTYGRTGVNYHNRLSAWNNYFVANPTRQPPISFAAQRQLINQLSGQKQFNRQEINNTFMVTNIKQVIKNEPKTFVRLADVDRTQINNRTAQIRNLTSERVKAEAKAKGPTAAELAGKDVKDRPVKLAGKGLDLPKANVPKPKADVPKRLDHNAAGGDGRTHVGKPVVPENDKDRGDKPNRNPNEPRNERPKNDNPNTNPPRNERPNVDKPKPDNKPGKPDRNPPKADNPKPNQPRVNPPKANEPKPEPKPAPRPRPNADGGGNKGGGGANAGGGGKGSGGANAGGGGKGTGGANAGGGGKGTGGANAGGGGKAGGGANAGGGGKNPGNAGNAGGGGKGGGKKGGGNR